MQSPLINVFITGNGNIQNIDKNLNFIKEFNNTGVQDYRGMFYNITNDLIYVGTQAGQVLIYLIKI
jgi:hypothetical protein